MTDKLDARTPMTVEREAFVDCSDGTRLYSVSTGAGPPVVLVHGFSGSVVQWNLIQPQLLEHGYSVLAYDQRGHGLSSLGSEGFTTAALHRDVLTFMQFHDVHGAIVVCHSMGNFAVLGALARHSELQQRVRAVVCVAPVIGNAARGARFQVALIRSGLMQFLSAVPVLGRIVAGLALGPNATHDVVEATRLTTARSPRKLGPLAAIVAHESIEDSLSEIDLPIRVLADDLTPQWHSDSILERAPRAVRTRVPVGHMINWEDPLAIIKAVEEVDAAHPL